MLSGEKLFPEDVVPTDSSIAKARSTLLSSQSRWRKEGSQPCVSVIWTISPFDGRFLSESWLLQAPDCHQEIIFLRLSRAVRVDVLTAWDLEAHNGIRVNTQETPW